MKLQLKSTASILALAMSLATSTIFAADNGEERKDSPEYAAAAAQPSRMRQSLEQLTQSLTDEQIAELLATIQHGNFSCSAPQLSQISPEERELKRLMSDSREAGLFPPLDPFRIKEVLNLLAPKYVKILQEGFANQLDFSNETHKDFFKFLMKHDHFITNDLCSDRSLLFVLKMLTQQFELRPYLAQYMSYGPPMVYGEFGDGIKDNTVLRECTKIIRGQLTVHMDSWYRNLEHTIKNVYYHYVSPMGVALLPQEEIKERVLAQVKEDINKKFSVPRGDKFDIEINTKEINQTVENWFNVVRQLAVFELQKWEHQQVLLDSLQRDYTIIDEQLKEAAAGHLHFSGITKTSHSIGLTEVERPEQASSAEFLQKRVNAHRQADEKKLSEYNTIKGVLPSLKKLVSWIDDVFAEVSKKGRMS